MATPKELTALAAVVPAAQACQQQYKIPASVTLAQWSFESSWGTSQLAGVTGIDPTLVRRECD